MRGNEKFQLKPETRVLRHSSESSGAQPVHETDTLKADVVVAGAYWLELLMGSETQEILTAADFPPLVFQ